MAELEVALSVPNTAKPPRLSEFWDAGYDRDCNAPTAGGRHNYLQFIEDVRAKVPSAGFKRPLQEHYVPATQSGKVEPFKLLSIPHVATDVAEQFIRQGAEVNLSTPAALAEKIKIEVEKWTRVVRAADIKLQ